MTLGVASPRADGPAKVTGQAPYYADHVVPDMLYGFLVQSTIGSGKIVSVDRSAAEAAPGVHRIFTPGDFPALHPGTLFPFGNISQSHLPLQTDTIGFNGQAAALVVADSFQEAGEAARLLQIAYEAGPFATDIADPAARPLDPAQTHAPPWIVQEAVRGNPDEALASAPVRIEADYSTARQQHCPMEPHGTLAAWDPEYGFTVWEPSQWPEGARAAIAAWLDVPFDKVRVVCPYVGGGFGSKIEPHPHVALACAAARALGRPVKLALSRQQSFSCHGPRPATRQHLAIGAQRDGKIVGLRHQSLNETTSEHHFFEACPSPSKVTYAVPNLHITQRLVEIDSVTPTTMRAPGYTPGSFALESALDELAFELVMDPIELRLRNYAEEDPDTGKPWSTRFLREAYRAGAERFGWERRTPQPRSMREGRFLVGMGMAGGTYPVYITPAEMRLRVVSDGRVEVETSGVDMGTGTYTIVAQTIAERLGLPVDRVSVRLGDTSYPSAPIAGGSQHANTMVRISHQIAQSAVSHLLSLAITHPDSPLRGMNSAIFDNGRIGLDGERTIDMFELLRSTGQNELCLEEDNLPADARSDADRHATFTTATRTVGGHPGYACASWCAQFAEVRVDPDLGTVAVTRMVGAFDCGLLYNPLLAESQWKGGMIMGLGAALFEDLAVDRRTGRLLNANLADYLLPVAADVPRIEVISVGQPDYFASPLGGKGVGEIGIVGASAAIANAVFHATGKRIRDLPITIEKLL